MPAIFSKNCILGGGLDWYCLACCALLPTAGDAVAHIQTAAHKHNLTELPYADKYKQDFIRKARGVYYCEVCNVTFPTAAKVGMHVTEATHVAGKTGRQLKRAGTAIVFNENTLITESAWNGLVDESCVLCNAEFDDESTHKSQQNHILNLINSSVTASAANDIYRKINGGYQCLTCNKVVPEDGITEHLNTEQHKSAFIRYDQNQNEVDNVKNDHVAETNYEDGDTTINIEEKSLHTSPVLMKGKKNPACSSDVKEVETLAKQHGLSLNKSSSALYCSACSVQVAATLDRINEHVNGKKHKGNLAKKSDIKKQITKEVKKTPENEFVFDFTELMNTNTNEQFVLINNRFCLKMYMSLGFTATNDVIICQYCNQNVTNMFLKEHLMSPSHQNGISKAFIISSLEDEYIREIRPDLYHCGYCGTVENDLAAMMNHLGTAEHERCKGHLVVRMLLFKLQHAGTDRMLHDLLRLG